MVVYVMIGVPGSGKSTYIKNNLKGLPIVSRDIARAELGFCNKDEKYLGTKEEEQQVTDYCNKLMKQYASKGIDFVIDNTHLKKCYRDSIKQVLNGYNVEYHYVCLITDKDIAIERRKQDFGDMSQSIINNMYKTLEIPQLSEYDYITFVSGDK